jgi:hypothetical protein
MPSRAWIDPITNIIRPRGVVLRRDIRSFLLGPWPVHTVQPFVHEFTHHWCFHSAVGLALALLRFRSLRRPPGSNEKTNAELFDEMLTVDTLLELIRPISEGLALFAEYDMAPGASSVITTPLQWTSIALSERSRLLDLARPQAAAELTERLINLRLSPDSLRRKMCFLSRPLTAVDNAYFDGYMTVKRLYLDLSQAVPALTDPDLFLFYLRSYFFEDYGMVGILAGEDRDVFHRLVAMIERFGARLEALYRPDLGQDVAIFENFNNRPPNSDRSDGIPGLGLTVQELQDGLNVQKDRLFELEDDPEADPTTRKILDAQRGWLSRRSLVYVASESIRVQVLNGVASAWLDPPDDEFPLFTGGSALSGVSDTEGKESGWISLVLQPTTGYFAALLGTGTCVAAIRWMNAVEPSPEAVELLSNPQCSPVAVEQEHDAVEAWIDAYYRQAPEPLSTYIEQTRQSTQSALQRIAECFLKRWGNDSEKALRCLQTTNRLRDLFGRNQNMFETFVALGALRHFDVLSPSLAAELSRRGWDVGAALRLAMQIQAKGVSLVRNDQGVFRWLV